jgi:hypothetical protein
MSLSITQTPAAVSLAQSPIIFTLSESTNVITSGSFQYIGELYYWTGSMAASSSTSNYTIVKYPNTQNVGIFDLNRIINSTLTDLAIANPSNVEYFAVDFYWQYQTGSVFVTGSHVKSSTYKALDGYGIFPENVTQSVYTKTDYWPLMTDGPVTQSFLNTNYGTSGVYVGDAGTTQPTKIVYTGNLGSGDFTLSSSTTTSGQIQQYPIGPNQSGFPISALTTTFSVQAYNGATPLGASIQYNLECIQKYPNVRIKWKNRFGQFDYFNFFMVNRQSFQNEKRTYQSTIGTWESSTFSYQPYNASTYIYVADNKQSISVNTFWIPESYNNILKQLLVSDEIYWVTDEATNTVKPLTITTQNITFKTGVVDKLIQYQFDFQFGQPFKLIL